MDVERLCNFDQLTNIDFPAAGLNSTHRVLADTNGFRQDFLSDIHVIARVGDDCASRVSPFFYCALFAPLRLLQLHTASMSRTRVLPAFRVVCVKPINTAQKP